VLYLCYLYYFIITVLLNLILRSKQTFTIINFSLVAFEIIQVSHPYKTDQPQHSNSVESIGLWQC